MSQDENQKQPGSLNRRDLLKVMTLAPAAALAPGMAASVSAASLDGGEAVPPAAFTPKALDPHQWKTLSVLCDLIIPEDGHSGSATQAGVPEFSDDFLEVRGEKYKTEMAGGLAWLDLRCNHEFGRDFVDCTGAEQQQMLNRIAYPGKSKPEDAYGAAFFMPLRDLIMDGFYTSEIGIADLQYQGNKMVAHWDGCPENVTSRLGVDYSNWRHWKG